MNARTLLSLRFCLLALPAVVCLAAIGCNRSDSEPASAPYAASGGIGDVADEPPSDSQPGGDPSLRVPDLPGSDLPQQPVGVMTDAAGVGAPAAGAGGEGAGNAATPFKLQESDPAESESVALRELKPDLSASELVEFLSGADQDIQMIVAGRSGIEDQREARQTLMHIIKMKLEASRRLSSRDDASEEERSQGKRGELQSMSHLAVLGDLKAATALETLAESNLQSDDPELVADSRTVLIGFAAEALQNGQEEAADRIIGYVDQILQSDAEPGVPAMMAMGQARHVLASYGHEDKARRVRDAIIRLFANSPDPNVAKMAAQFAGNVRFDEIDQMRGNVIDGNAVETTVWVEAVETLISESADLQTVQYLAGAALEFESVDAHELAQATYDVMQKRFTDLEAATGREVRLAVAAGQARRDVIGTRFQPALPGVDGSPLEMADYKGKVVLIPFWATGFPESLQLIPRIKAIASNHGDDVAVIGMNLDIAGAPVEEFAAANELHFPSYRSVSSATAEVANPMAAQFGMVSMPFTAIIDQEGRVAGINFTGRNLEETVAELIGR